MTWFHRLRLKLLAFLTGLALAAVALLSLTAWPMWSVVGVAVAAAAVAVHKVGGKLSQPTCYGCGRNLADREPGVYGVVCDHCGTVSLGTPLEDDTPDRWV